MCSRGLRHRRPRQPVIERRQRNGGSVRWRVRWRGPDGSQHSKSFRTQREAKTFESNRVALRGAWIAPNQGALKLSEIWPSYIAAQTHAKPSTVSGYTYIWHAYIEPEFGSWSVNQIQFADVAGWIAHLSSMKGPATTRKSYRVLSMLLEWSVRAKYVARNEAVGVRLPRQTTKLPRVADVSTVERLASTVPPPARDMILLLGYTGLRWGEAAALRVCDVNLARRRLTVSRNFVEVEGKLRLGTPKSHRSREVPIPLRLLDLLSAGTHGRGPEEILFARENGSPWRNSNFRRDSQWAKSTATVGIPGFRIHDLRHTAASLMIESGASVVDVAAVLGHASSHTTLTIYAHLIGARLDQVADQLDRKIADSCGPNVAHGEIQDVNRRPQERGK